MVGGLLPVRPSPARSAASVPPRMFHVKHPPPDTHPGRPHAVPPWSTLDVEPPSSTNTSTPRETPMHTAQDIARAEIAEWIATAPNTRHNPDGHYGLQCVDLADSYVETLFGLPWRDTIGAVAGAKSLFDTANPEFFTKVENNPADHNQVAPEGAILIWWGSPLNEWGHVAVNVRATAAGVRCIQQDGFAAPTKYVTHPDGKTGAYYSDKPAHYADLGWDNPGTGPIRGWLIPRPEKIRDTKAITRGFGKVEVPKINPTATVTPTGVMHGVDLASWQKGIDLGTVPADFAIIKVTGGTHYLNPEAKAHVKEARAAGKLIGLYHYAAEDGRKGTAEAEAKYFLDHALPLADEHTVFVLDWEHESIIGDARWAVDALSRIAKETGTTPWLYGYQNALKAHDWTKLSRTPIPLWFAWYGSDAEMVGYATDFALPFKTPAGLKLVAWQYSQRGKLRGFSGHIDLNVFFGDANAWKSYATGKSPRAVKPQAVPAKAKASASNTNTASTFPATVESGDTFTSIANQFKVPIDALRKANPQVKDINRLAVGQRLNIPGVLIKTTQAVVEAGDTLFSIAEQFKTTVADLRAANPQIKNPNLIQPGQVLNLPQAKPVRVSQVVVETGDTLSGIADQFGTTVQAIVARNRGLNPDLIQPGQVLNL